MTLRLSLPGPRELGFAVSGARGLVKFTPTEATDSRACVGPLGRVSASGLTSKIFADIEDFLPDLFLALVGVLLPAEAAEA
jgi:hypothetical protein